MSRSIGQSSLKNFRWMGTHRLVWEWHTQELWGPPLVVCVCFFTRRGAKLSGESRSIEIRSAHRPPPTALEIQHTTHQQQTKGLNPRAGSTHNQTGTMPLAPPPRQAAGSRWCARRSRRSHHHQRASSSSILVLLMLLLALLLLPFGSHAAFVVGPCHHRRHGARAQSGRAAGTTAMAASAASPVVSSFDNVQQQAAIRGTYVRTHSHRAKGHRQNRRHDPPRTHATHSRHKPNQTPAQRPQPRRRTRLGTRRRWWCRRASGRPSGATRGTQCQWQGGWPPW